MTDDTTDTSRLEKTRRRFLLALSGLGATFALPARASAAAPPEMSTDEAIQHHAEALLALVRTTFPETATGYRIHLSWEAGMGDTPIMMAAALERVWETDSRIRGGGLMVDRGAGRWRLENGGRVECDRYSFW